MKSELGRAMAWAVNVYKEEKEAVAAVEKIMTFRRLYPDIYEERTYSEIIRVMNRKTERD